MTTTQQRIEARQKFYALAQQMNPSPSELSRLAKLAGISAKEAQELMVELVEVGRINRGGSKKIFVNGGSVEMNLPRESMKFEPQELSAKCSR